ncbi:MAG TPA: hypothetical protein VJ870_13200 [Amycolatopsis sp.]|nr:hypothetical protein [Amycolatopsis sp.]
MTGYRDRWIECTEDAIRVRGYYFPWGAKKIPYASIGSVRRVETGLLRGRGRIWGTANPRYWAGLDPRRPAKETALILDLGRFVHPFVTPDDPDAVESIIRLHADVGPADETTRGPIV